VLPWQPFLAFYIQGAHWRHLKNTTEPSMCGGDAALCQITLTTCFHLVHSPYDRCFSVFEKAFSCRLQFYAYSVKVVGLHPAVEEFPAKRVCMNL